MSMIIGHRGSRHLWPENTLEGFGQLVNSGVEGVEFDVHLTADDQVIVIHDATLERTTHSSGPVRTRTLSELQSLRLRDSVEGLPSLEQVLEVFQNSALELHIELKTDSTGQPYPGLEAQVIGTIAQFGLQQRSVLTSFNHEVLQKVRHLDSSARVLRSVDHSTLAQAGGFKQAMIQLEALPDLLVAVEQSLLKETLQQFSARFGADRLGVWVVNHDADLRYWFRQHLRQITTDRVDLALQSRART
ncbi:glycerophosphodiester phosphodiesterase family protein [Deinococcus deserti]|uniref:Putative glycerophosphoryl diester phosphodiesterase n=2 Tax=Deinococcus TaxID=1298 RepID=C1D2D0_DEIDV|nr:glycerophosphodiester phosphodiesterase family protein [Deinococcus deserti]ACO47569.1 putative glycerophosphoryl diester phosphodiesterase [Deinococcus deserti VCD115]